jgi:hypothetical protein
MCVYLINIQNKFVDAKEFYFFSILGLLEFCAKGLNRKLGCVCGYICIYVYTWSMVKKCLRSINTSKPHESPNHVYMEINVRGRYICLNTYVLYIRAKITRKKVHHLKCTYFFYQDEIPFWFITEIKYNITRCSSSVSSPS